MFTNAILYYGLHTSSVGTVKTYNASVSAKAKPDRDCQ